MWQLIEYPVFYTSLTYSLLYMPSEYKIFNFIAEDVHLSGPSFSLQSTTSDLPCIYISIFATSNKCIRPIYFHIAERYQRNIISPVWPLFSAGKRAQFWCAVVTEHNHQYCHHLPPTPPKISINHSLFLSADFCREVQMSRGLWPEIGRGWPAAFRGSDGLWRPQIGPQVSTPQIKEKTIQMKAKYHF